MLDFKGIIPPLATPFDESGAVQYDAFEGNFDKYLEAGIKGYLILGSTGESVYLEHSEKIGLVKAARKRLAKSMTLLVGTGQESTRATIELTKELADLGADAVLVKNPFYYKSMMNYAVYLAHYSAVADASPVPVIVYNVPVFTGISMEAKLLIELSKHPNIHGLKESSGEVGLMSQVVWNTDRARYPVMVGSAPTLFPCLTAGASGGVVAMADAAPKAMMDLYHAFVSGNYKKAANIQRIIAPAALAVTAKYGIPGLKAAMTFQGFRGGHPRSPLLPVSPAQREEIQELFRKMNSELAEQ